MDIKEKKRLKVRSLLLKYGNTEQSTDEIIKNNFDYVYKTYRTATPSKLASIIICL